MGRTNIILASASPRRIKLLDMLLRNFGMSFKVKPAHIAEDLPEKSAKPEKIAVKFAFEKVISCREKNKGIIIGADTIVVIDQKILGKPKSDFEARRMLKLLSGKTHKVYTGVAIINGYENKKIKFFEETKVTFRKLSVREIDFYIKSGSHLDKAGAYGIQDDLGSTFVSGIDGDYFNVVGLPIVKTYLFLKKFINFGV
jgi:nucleoside triphosphate pyrophosphatase